MMHKEIKGIEVLRLLKSSKPEMNILIQSTVPRAIREVNGIEHHKRLRK